MAVLTFAPVLFGANGVAARIAVDAVSPMVLVLLRWAIVVAALAVVLDAEQRRELLVLLRHHPLRLAWMGLLGYSGFNALFYTAAYSTSAVNLTLLQCLIPALVLIGAAVVFRVRVTILQAIGMVLTVIGALVVATGGDIARLANLTFNRGDALVLVTCFFYAAYTLGLRVRPPGSALVFFAGLALSSLLWSVPMAAGEVLSGHGYWPSLKGWMAAVFIAFGPSFAAQICFLRGVDLIGPSRAGLFTNLTPIFGALAAVLVLGERFSAAHAVATALALGGIALAEWRELPRRRPNSAVHVEPPCDAPLP